MISSGAFHPPFRGWSLFFCGLCMGAADLVPGISGGTIAFVLGFYPYLLKSLQTFNWPALRYLFKGQWQEFSRCVAWKFLLTLLAGIACAIIGLANFFHFILDHEVYRVYLYATFLGLILASLIFCIRQIRIWKRGMLKNFLVGALAAYLLTNATLNPSIKKEEFAIPLELNVSGVALLNYDAKNHLLTGLSSQTLSGLLSQGLIKNKTPVYNRKHVLIGVVEEFVTPYPSAFFNSWLMLCGALAVCALLLPGISGSYVLSLLGVYPTVIDALVEFINDLGKLSLNSEAFSILWSLGFGIGVGALCFARIINWLLKYRPDQSLALLSGITLGAIRSVWPFWSCEYALIPLKLYKGPQLIALHPFIPSWDSLLLWQAVLCVMLGFVFVFFLNTYSKKKQRNLKAS